MLTPGELYDASEEAHDYRGDSDALRGMIEARLPEATTLLDLACGTGRHLPYLRERFEVEGVDLNPSYLDRARLLVPGVPLHQLDMTDFDLGRRFDVVINMGSAIGSVRTRERLDQTMLAIARHLRPGGLLICEPFLSPERWPENSRRGIAVFADSKVARASITGVEDGLATIDFHFMAITPEGEIQHVKEHYALGLFSDDDYRAALAAAGFERIEHDPSGLFRKPPRGLLLARASSDTHPGGDSD